MKFKKTCLIMLCISLISTILVGTAIAQTESAIAKNLKGNIDGKAFVSHQLTLSNEEFDKMATTTDSTTKAQNTITSKLTTSLPYYFGFQLYPEQSARTKGTFSEQTGYTVTTTAYTTGGTSDIWYYNVDLLKSVWYGWTTVASNYNINYGYDSCSFSGCDASATYCFNFYNPSESIQVWVDDGDGIVSAY
ncbi:MAG: hypothetical protein PHI70_04125 [Proteiniphilum sp.]|nr:hypothetical protein [Proteiniphilum sp.]MDD3908627.1 hypothetical protein [Proteiniphilum sp.]MDD4415955.1 hypothetical protein [Proteiniphilum sp.]